jgi:hypothetical protein
MGSDSSLTRATLPASNDGSAFNAVRPRRRMIEPPAKSLNSPDNHPQPLPRWVVQPTGPAAIVSSGAGDEKAFAAGSIGDLAFAAGAAFFALDQIIRCDPAWLGALRMRLALKAALAAARLLRRDADAQALRDAQHLTRPGDDPGPAGRLHDAIRRWASRPLRLAAETEREIAAEAGAGRQQAGASELAALLAADRVLAERSGWASALPLHLSAIHDPALRQSADGRRPRADQPGFAAVRHTLLLHAARAAHADAVTIARRAEALKAAAATLRTRDEGRGLALVLADDSVAPWRMAGKNAAGQEGMGSDRAARRFCDSLHGLGALRLLTDRPTFRLYAL